MMQMSSCNILECSPLLEVHLVCTPDVLFVSCSAVKCLQMMKLTLQNIDILKSFLHQCSRGSRLLEGDSSIVHTPSWLGPRNARSSPETYAQDDVWQHVYLKCLTLLVQEGCVEFQVTQEQPSSPNVALHIMGWCLPEWYSTDGPERSSKG